MSNTATLLCKTVTQSDIYSFPRNVTNPQAMPKPCVFIKIQVSISEQLILPSVQERTHSWGAAYDKIRKNW